MTGKLRILLFVFFFMFIRIASSNQRQFDVTGIIGGLLEGERVYLTMLSKGGDSKVENIKFDSAIVENGIFHFKGSIPGSPRMFWMGFGRHSQFIVLVLSNEKLVIKVKDINILPAGSNVREFATIEGSETDRNWQDLIGLTKMYILFTNSMQRYMVGMADSLKYDARILTGAMAAKKLFDAQLLQILLAMPNKDAVPVFLWNLSLYINREALLSEIYNSLSDSLKDSYHGKIVSDISRLCVGQPASEISGYGLDGKFISLKEVVSMSKATYVYFWSADCPRCFNDVLKLNEQYEKYHKKGFNVFGVSLDTALSVWNTALKNNKFSGYQIVDRAGSNITDVYRIRGLPMSVLIDRDGKIVCWNINGFELQWYLEKIFEER